MKSGDVEKHLKVPPGDFWGGGEGLGKIFAP